MQGRVVAQAEVVRGSVLASRQLPSGPGFDSDLDLTWTWTWTWTYMGGQYRIQGLLLSISRWRGATSNVRTRAAHQELTYL